METQDGGSTAGFSTAGHDRLPEGMARPTVASLPALTILCHPNLERIGERTLLTELVRGREALISRQQPGFTAPGTTEGRALEDRYVSRKPLCITAGPDGTVELRRTEGRTPAAVDGAPLEDSVTLTPQQLDTGVVVTLAQRVVLLLHRLARPPDAFPPPFELVGDSAGMVQVRQTIERVAPLEVPVLLRGETGTGKELVARALHEHSPRRHRPFVCVNLGALSPSLATSELFGAVKGAFTGADRDRPGYFASADGGTLFFDEIGEAAPGLQVMLLRVLETREVLPVGSQKPRPVDVRVISATDADLDRLVAGGDFRAPLLHRLMSYTLCLPPLRERRDDIGRLLIHFLLRERAELGDSPPPITLNIPWLPAALVERLVRYDWPGNVRQLRNVARKLVIDSRGQPALDEAIDLEALLPEPARLESAPSPSLDGDDTLSVSGGNTASNEAPLPTPSAPEPPPEPCASPPRRKPSAVSEKELLAALRRHGFELKSTAADLGVSRTSLYALVDRSPHVRSASDVPPEEIRAAFARCSGDVAGTARDLEVSERALRQRLKDLGLR